LHGIVEAISQICQADDKSQLDYLVLTVVFAQFRQAAFSHSGRAAGDSLRVENSGLFLFVESFAAAVKLKRLDLLVGDAYPLRRSGMGARSVFTAIDHGSLQVGELLVPGLDSPFRNDRAIQRKEILQDGGPMRHDSKEVRYAAEFFLQIIVDFGKISSGLFLRYGINYSHDYYLLQIDFRVKSCVRCKKATSN
jgi:hypothetical protein